MAGLIGDLFQPGDSDWIVTVWTKRGDRFSRRISPGRMDEIAALRIALNASSLSYDLLERWTARRAGERSVVSSSGEDFLEVIRRTRI